MMMITEGVSDDILVMATVTGDGETVSWAACLPGESLNVRNTSFFSSVATLFLPPPGLFSLSPRLSSYF